MKGIMGKILSMKIQRKTKEEVKHFKSRRHVNVGCYSTQQKRKEIGQRQQLMKEDRLREKRKRKNEDKKRRNEIACIKTKEIKRRKQKKKRKKKRNKKWRKRRKTRQEERKEKRMNKGREEL